MFFFVCSWWRKNEWLRVISVKSFNIKVFVKNSTVGTVIYLLERIKSYVGYLQFMVEQEHNLVGHLILPWIFIVGQNLFFFIWSDNFWFWSDIVRCPTVILKPVKGSIFPAIFPNWQYWKLDTKKFLPFYWYSSIS